MQRERNDTSSPSASSPPLGPLNLVSKSIPQPKPLAMQDHILDLSKKRNTTYYDQINLIKEHTSPRDTLEKVAAMLNSKYSMDPSVQRDLQLHQRAGGSSSSSFSATTSSLLARKILAASPPRIPEMNVKDAASTASAAASSSASQVEKLHLKAEERNGDDMQISPVIANREGIQEEEREEEREEEQLASRERPPSSSAASVENDLVNVVDDETPNEAEAQAQPLPLLRTNAA